MISTLLGQGNASKMLRATTRKSVDFSSRARGNEKGGGQPLTNPHQSTTFLRRAILWLHLWSKSHIRALAFY
jgi:hypothetical protein